MNRSENTEVLIVGAGPTGLLLANWLLKLGIGTVIIDSKSGPTRESRALGVQARSMEIYDQLGIIDRILEHAVPAGLVRAGYGRQVWGTIALGRLGVNVSQYPHIYILEQSRTEAVLAGNLADLGGGVRWKHTLESLHDDGGGVRAQVASPAGPSTLSARYCIGADGGTSAVRRFRGIPFEGITNDRTFYVCDAVAAKGIPADSVNIRAGKDDFLLTFPMGPGGHQRLIGVLRERNPEAGEGVTEKGVRRHLESFFGVTFGPSRWFSTYSVHHRVAARFRDGPVFLAGDAAHVHSPVGAQGMNTGLQDAHNLAFKLADVLRGGASEEYLDRYGAERRPVALRLVKTTDRVFGVVTSQTAPARFFRRWFPRIMVPLVARLAPRLSGAERFFGYISQTRIHYRMGDGARSRRGGVFGRSRRGKVVGRRLQWMGPNFEPLKSLAWQVHVYGDVEPALVRNVQQELGLAVHRFRAAPWTGLRNGQFYLVRPDGFVAAEAPGAEAPATFRRALPVR